jgi:hypothetical protein
MEYVSGWRAGWAGSAGSEFEIEVWLSATAFFYEQDFTEPTEALQAGADIGLGNGAVMRPADQFGKRRGGEETSMPAQSLPDNLHYLFRPASN